MPAADLQCSPDLEVSRSVVPVVGCADVARRTRHVQPGGDARRADRQHIAPTSRLNTRGHGHIAADRLAENLQTCYASPIPTSLRRWSGRAGCRRSSQANWRWTRLQWTPSKPAGSPNSTVSILTRTLARECLTQRVPLGSAAGKETCRASCSAARGLGQRGFDTKCANGRSGSGGAGRTRWIVR